MCGLKPTLEALKTELRAEEAGQSLHVWAHQASALMPPPPRAGPDNMKKENSDYKPGVALCKKHVLYRKQGPRPYCRLDCFVLRPWCAH